MGEHAHDIVWYLQPAADVLRPMTLEEAADWLRLKELGDEYPTTTLENWAATGRIPRLALNSRVGFNLYILRGFVRQNIQGLPQSEIDDSTDVGEENATIGSHARDAEHLPNSQKNSSPVSHIALKSDIATVAMRRAESPLVTIGSAARQVGKARGYVRALIEKGKLQAFKIGGSGNHPWLAVELEELRRLVKCEMAYTPTDLPPERRPHKGAGRAGQPLHPAAKAM